MYSPTGYQGSSSAAQDKIYTNTISEEELISPGFMMPLNPGFDRTSDQPRFSPSQGMAIHSDDGRKPYEWTDKDTVADKVISLVPTGPTYQPQMSSQMPPQMTEVIHHDPSINYPMLRTSNDLDVLDEGTSSVDSVSQNTFKDSWWKIVLVILFAVIAAIFWVRLVDMLLVMFNSNQVVNSIIYVTAALVFTFLVFLIAWFT